MMPSLAATDWLGLGVLALQVLVVELLVLCLSGHFPLAVQQPEFKSPAGRLLLTASVLVCALSVVLAVGFALRRLPVPSAIIAAGVALLTAPLILKQFPDRFVDGRQGLVVLGGLAAALGLVLARGFVGP